MGIGLGIGINRSNYAQGIFNAYQSRVIADGGITEAGACVDAVSGLLLTASLLLIPSGYKSGKAYAQIPTNGNGDLTWTRASTAIRTNSSGLLESMGSGVPRLSYMYGSCPALLLEPQRTNLALQSESFDNASWTKNNSTVTANTTTSPDGTTNADTMTGDGTLIAHNVLQASPVVNGTAYTFTIYAKKNTNNFIQITGGGGTFGSFFANFDLNNGVVGSSALASNVTIQLVGNGWYRCSATATSIFTGSGNVFFVCLITSATSLRLEANTLSTSVFLWGAQLEAGAYPTTYIPTTTASATRIADSFSRNNIYTNGLITSSGGTWFVELRGNVAYTRDASSRIGFGDTSNLQNNSFFLNPQFGGGRFLIFKSISNSLTQLFTTTTSTIKVAIKWNGSTADVFVNGTKQVSATAFTTTNMEFLFGDGVGVPTFVQAMALYPSPLSDTDCTTLTTL
jgi:hypothetical protein